MATQSLDNLYRTLAYCTPYYILKDALDLNSDRIHRSEMRPRCMLGRQVLICGFSLPHLFSHFMPGSPGKQKVARDEHFMSSY